MKKIIITLLTFGFIVTGTQQAEAVSSRPSDLKVGPKDFKATLLQDVQVFNVNAYRDNKDLFTKLKAGSTVTVTEHRLEHGYNYLILKGNKYIAVDDETIQITQPLKTDIQYSPNYKMSPHAASNLKQAQGKKYYKEYKQYINNADHKYFRFFKEKDEELALVLIGSSGMIQSDSRGIASYQDWLKNGRSTADSDLQKTVKEQQKINILSDTFKKSYFNKLENPVLGRQAGDICGKANASFMVNDYMMTDLGMAQIGRNAGYVPNDNMKRVKGIIIVPYKKVSFQQMIQYYGKPFKEEMLRKYRVEHHLIYQKKGYQVIVALDSYRGNVKYIYKQK